MKKLITFLFLLLLPLPLFAQEDQEPANPTSEIFKAQVIEILGQEEVFLENEGKIIQQDLKLKGLSGSWKDKEFEFKGIAELQVVNSSTYQVGDKVVVNYEKDTEDNDLFIIIDYARGNSLIWAGLLFVVLILLIAGLKGFKALFSLGLTAGAIIFFIVPRIFQGADPILTSIVGGGLIVLIAIYFTEGFNLKSHLAVASIYLSLLFTGLISQFFIKLSHLSGTVDEEVMFLIDSTKVVNFQGLLLAGIILGTIGVLDDLVISQMSTVEEIKKANPTLRPAQVYAQAKKVGVSHLSSIVNTLFLAYVSVSLPLLILFYVKTEPFTSIGQVINSEMIATEIIRTIVGICGLLLVMPIATYLAAKYLKTK